MKTETARHCIAECRRFIKAWEDFEKKAAHEASIPDNSWRHTSDIKDWLENTSYLHRERAFLRRTSLDLSNALADLRQGR